MLPTQAPPGDPTTAQLGALLFTDNSSAVGCCDHARVPPPWPVKRLRPVAEAQQALFCLCEPQSKL